MRAPVGVLSLVLAGLCGCGGLTTVVRDFNLTADWGDYDRLVVVSRNGSVQVAPGEVNQLELAGTLRVRGETHERAQEYLDELKIVAVADPSMPRTFRVEFVVPHDLREKSPGADLQIKVPVACAVDIDTNNGAIEVQDLPSARLDTSNGSITAVRITGAVEADTSNGRIVVREVGGPCLLDTSNGAVEVRGCAGAVTADTSNGSIRVEAAPPPDAKVHLATRNGSIDCTIAPRLAGRVDLRTSNGSLRTEFGPAAVKHLRQEKTHLEAELNGGGAGELIAATTNGSITLVLRP